MTTAIILAIAASFCFGLGLVLTQIGLKRSIAPVAGAAISVPSAMVVIIAAAPFALDMTDWSWMAIGIFTLIGLFYPAGATLLTFEANLRIGPVMTGTLGNLAPIFAVTFAVLALGETLSLAQGAGLAVIIAGIMLLTAPRDGGPAHWRSPVLLLPLAAALIRGVVQPFAKFGFTFWPSPYALGLVSYIVSTVIVLIAVRIRTGHWHAQAPLSARMTFVGVGMANAAAALLLYAALANGPVALVSPLAATYPLATIALGALFLGRIDGGLRLVGAVALTVIGVVLLLIS